MHSEMMPLCSKEKEKNELVLFQIWLNLDKKAVDPYFTMLWSEKNLVIRENGATVTVLADTSGKIGKAQPAPPDSWASQPNSDVAIVLIELAVDGTWTIPATASTTNRQIFFYEGDSLTVDSATALTQECCLRLDPTKSVELRNSGKEVVHLLLLQGRPIGKPVVQRGPFVAESQNELQSVIQRYQRTQFGGWPWDRNDPIQVLDKPRFALHPDGREEYPDNATE